MFYNWFGVDTFQLYPFLRVFSNVLVRVYYFKLITFLFLDEAMVETYHTLLHIWACILW